MRAVTWNWLVLVFLDGLVLGLLGPGSASAITLGVLVIGAVVMGLLTILTPRAPLYVVGPTVVVVAWRLLWAMPLPLWTWGTGWLGRVEAVVQLLVVAAVAWVWVRVEHDPEGPRGASWRRSMGLSAAGLVIGPLGLAVYLWTSVALLFRVTTGGYIGLDHRGLRISERIFERDGTTIHLVAMVHIGEAEAYDALFDSFCGLPEAVVLIEADVLDRTQPSSPYGPVAQRLGLVAQPHMPDCGPQVRPGDIFAHKVSESTMAFLNASWEAVEGKRVTFPMDGDDPAVQRRMLNEVVALRNEGLLRTIDEADGAFEHIVVPWGGAHMPGIERQLLSEGWTEIGKRDRVLIRYRTVVNR